MEFYKTPDRFAQSSSTIVVQFIIISTLSGETKKQKNIRQQEGITPKR